MNPYIHLFLLNVYKRFRTIPKAYPHANVSFKMHNPIPHHWSDGDSIKCPVELYDKPLVDIVWSVVSKFVDYDKYVSGKREHEDDKATEAKIVESFTKLKQEIVHALNNPPQSAQQHLKSLSDSKVKVALESKSELFKLIYKSENLEDVVKDTKKQLVYDEHMATKSITNKNKMDNVLHDLQQNINYLEKISGNSKSKFSTDTKKTVIKVLRNEIVSLQRKIDRRKDSVYSGRKTYKEVRDDILDMFKKLNTLHVLYIAVKSDTLT